MSLQITHKDWGRFKGREVRLFELYDPSAGMRAGLSNYGAVLRTLEVRDGAGAARDIVLGYDRLEDYLEDSTFFGAMIGPIADRLAEGRCELGGRAVRLPLNAGPDSMHSGPDGFHHQVWDWEILDDGIRFFRQFEDRELGFPGRMEVSLSYRMPEAGKLRLGYQASCSAETAVSFTNHSYFNLDGAEGDCREHTLMVAAGQYAQTRREQDPIVTGRLMSVEGTPLDFRRSRRIEEAVSRLEHPEIRAAGGVDHYFVVDGRGRRCAAVLKSRRSGITLHCYTDAPGLLVYTGNGLDGAVGKGGRVYGRNWGVCLETGRMPNAVNIPAYRRDVLLRAGEVYRSETDFIIGSEAQAGS